MAETQQLFLYKLTPTSPKWGGWETYESAVVVAANEQAAREIHPNTYMAKGGGWLYPARFQAVEVPLSQASDESPWDDDAWDDYVWPPQASEVTAILLGTAAPGLVPGVVCTVYHTG